jgi:hypothetical protein
MHDGVCNDEVVDAAAATLVAAGVPFVVANLALHRFRPPYGLQVLGGDVEISRENPRYAQGPYDVAYRRKDLPVFRAHSSINEVD